MAPVADCPFPSENISSNKSDYNRIVQIVQLFSTCLIDSFYPHTGLSIVNILRKVGLDVEIPGGQTCCGQPPYNAGLHPDARQIAEHTIKVFEDRQGDIVIPSGSCAHMIKVNYPELFAGDGLWLPRAKALGERVYEFTQFLVDKLGISDLGARWEGSLAYHPSCHTLRGMGIDSQPRLLLSNVKGAQIVELTDADECCGFGGIFSVEHPELSAELMKRKISKLEQSTAPTLVVTEAGCLMHIAGGLHRQHKPQKVMHISEILDRT
jgi:L-lactate dehydrogenase complex protein LldE